MMLDHTLRRNIIDFLLGFHFFDDPNSRKALLLTAGLNPVLPTIALSGNPQEFVTVLVDRLDEYGTLPEPDGRDSVVALLKVVNEMVGQEGRQTCADLMTRVQDARRQAQTQPRSDPKPVRRKTRNDRHNGGTVRQRVGDHGIQITDARDIIIHQHGSEPPTTPSPPDEAEIRAYCRKAAALHEKIPLMGFKTNLRVSIRIEDIYVPLHAMIDDRLTGPSAFADAEDAENALRDCRGGCEISVPEAFVEAEKRQRRGIVILGDPGSGKTTHLKRVLLWCLRGGLGAPTSLSANIIPVFLPLRELRDVTQNLDDFIQEQLSLPHLGTPQGFGQRLLARGNLLLLFDGLDEVADAAHRSKVARWIETALTMYDTCRFVITCRFAGYTDDARLDADFVEMHLRPMTAEQAETFVRNWYGIVEGAQASDPDQAALAAQTKADNLIERLRQPDFRARRVFELTRNPLLLTNICLVHLSRGNLPHTRVAVYDECTEVLLERWRGAKGAQSRITAQIGRQVLQPAAYWLHQQQGRTRATADELAPVIASELKKLRWSASVPRPFDTLRTSFHSATPTTRSSSVVGERSRTEVEMAHEFLQAVRDESGLLTGWDQRQYGFMHLGFQEYLAAREIRNRAYQNPAILAELAANLGESWWQEVILLLLALADPCVFEPFMRAVAALPVFAAQPQMLDLCLDDAAEQSPQPFLELLEQNTGQDKELWQRQFLALQLVARLDPERVAALAPALRRHPSPKIQQWLREQDEQAQQQVIIVEKSGTELVFIPGGVFRMGSKEHRSEQPVHELRITDFYLGRYSVTNAEYGRFLAANPKMKEPVYWGDRRYNQPNQPVVGVSWHDAQRFVAWLNELTPRPPLLQREGEQEYGAAQSGNELTPHPRLLRREGVGGEFFPESTAEIAGGRGPFRLPSEAEWEYACRAGATTRYYTGDTEADLDRAGWYDDNSGGNLHLVGEKEPNAFGLYDMHGNVWEWCEDTWHKNYEGAPDDGRAWVSSGGSNRVLRGGSWNCEPHYLRSAHRYRYAPSYRGGYLGFRVCRSRTAV